MEYSTTEMMVVTASRRLRDGERVLVGIGMPNLAANLAKRTHAPNLVLIYESGVIGSEPVRLPLSIGDPCLVTRAQSVCTMFEGLAFYLQGGLIDVGFLGGAQIDRFGNINSTVIGEYGRPKVRLPGSGGACDIASLALRIIVVTPHEKRRFPEKVDFITSPGFLGGRQHRKDLGLLGQGPDAIITDLGVLEFDEIGEMFLASLHPGMSIDAVKERTGWDIKISSELRTTAPPTEEELRVLRELDPDGIYLGGAE